MDEFGEGAEATMSCGFAMARGAGVKCGRWNPTAEQVKVLTDLFRSGLRTPTTDQIQMISSHLSAFGKIESKNVFYWFQNHKARERHHKKRRRGWSPEELEEEVVVGGGSGGGRDTQKARSRCFTGCMRGEMQEAMWEGQEVDIRANETLELFPLKSYGMEQAEKLRPMGGELCKGRALLDAGRDPPLDLRLSFW